MLESRYIILMLGCLIAGTAAIEAINLQYPEVIYSGYDNVIKGFMLERCDEPVPYTRNVPVWSLVCISENYLGDGRIIPFISGIALLPLTFLLSNQITKDRRISIFATFLVSLNPLFLIFNDSSAYNQIWAVALMGAMYLTFKKPMLSIPLFVFAVIAKPMAILFIPMMLAMTWKNKKVFASYMIVSTAIIGIVLSLDTIIQSKTALFVPTMERVELAFENLWFNLTKHTSIITIPLIAFSMLHKNRMIQFLIGVSLLEILLLPMFTVYTTYPYRLLPLVAFASIGVALATKHLLYSKKELKVMH